MSRTARTIIMGSSWLNQQVSGGVADFYASFDSTISPDQGSYSLTPSNVTVSSAQSKFGGASASSAGATNSYISPSPSILLDSTTSWSFSCWVYLNDSGTSSDMNMVGSQYLSSGSAGRMLFGEQSGQLVLRINGGTVYLTGAITTGAWTHVVLCRTGSVYSLFINGTRVDTNSSVPTFAQDVTLTLMGQPSGQLGGYCLNGYMDDVVINLSGSLYDPTATSINIPTQSFA